MSSKDTYPQSIRFNSALTVANEWSSVTVEIPFFNLTNPPAGKARVLEILDVTMLPLTVATTAVTFAIGGFDYGTVTTTVAPSTQVVEDIRMFLVGVVPVTAAAYPLQSYDLSYGGKGLLFPNSQITVNTNSGATASNRVNIEITYRIRTVPLKEYIDIINQYQIGGTIL